MKGSTPILTIGLALALPAALAAQTPPASGPLVRTWVRTIDGKAWGDSLQGKTRQEFLTLRADSTYVTQIKTTAPTLLGTFWFGERADSVTGQLDSAAGTGPLLWGRWRQEGDTLKFGRAGRYAKYRATVQGPELILTMAYPVDTAHHSECTEAFTRVESGQPLPAPNPKAGCQTLAGALPRPPLPKPTEILGAWAAIDSSTWGSKKYPAPHICGGSGPCTLVQYDTLTFQADSTLLHKQIGVSPAQPNGYDTQLVAPKAQWWMAGDTLWIQWVMMMNGTPVQIVYDNGKPRKATPIKNAINEVWFEDGGRYLHYQGSIYHRVALAKP